MMKYCRRIKGNRGSKDHHPLNLHNNNREVTTSHKATINLQGTMVLQLEGVVAATTPHPPGTTLTHR